MQGDLQVPSEAVAGGARSGEIRRSNRRQNRKVTRRRKPCGIISRSRKIHTVAQAAGGSSAIPKSRNRGNLGHGASAPPKGCRAGKPAHRIAGKAGPERPARGNPHAPHRRPSGRRQATGQPEAGSTPGGPGIPGAGETRTPSPTGAARTADPARSTPQRTVSRSGRALAARGNPQPQRKSGPEGAHPPGATRRGAAPRGLNGSRR